MNLAFFFVNSGLAMRNLNFGVLRASLYTVFACSDEKRLGDARKPEYLAFLTPKPEYLAFLEFVLGIDF